MKEWPITPLGPTGPTGIPGPIGRKGVAGPSGEDIPVVGTFAWCSHCHNISLMKVHTEVCPFCKMGSLGDQQVVQCPPGAILVWLEEPA